MEQIKESENRDNQPKISVIVPVYNVEKYLRRCIDSILAQTFTDFEVLLIDDGSTDTSGNICDEYAEKDPRIRVFHKENGGVSSARNRGLDNARGEWICFVDSDDWIDNVHLYDFMSFNTDLVINGYKQISSDSNSIELIKTLDNIQVYSTKEIMSLLCNIFSFHLLLGIVWNKRFRRDIIIREHIYFDEDISFREDEIFVFEYCKFIQSAATSNSITYNYVHYNNSLMHNTSYKDPDTLIYIFKKSLTASINLNPPLYFRNLLNQYYIDSLTWAGWLMYYDHKIYPYKKRIKLQKEIINYAKNNSLSINKRFIKINSAYLNDLLLLFRYFIKITCRTLQKNLHL